LEKTTKSADLRVHENPRGNKRRCGQGYIRKEANRPRGVKFQSRPPPGEFQIYRKIIPIGNDWSDRGKGYYLKEGGGKVRY